MPEYRHVVTSPNGQTLFIRTDNTFPVYVESSTGTEFKYQGFLVQYGEEITEDTEVVSIFEPVEDKEIPSDVLVRHWVEIHSCCDNYARFNGHNATCIAVIRGLVSTSDKQTNPSEMARVDTKRDFSTSGYAGFSPGNVDQPMKLPVVTEPNKETASDLVNECNCDGTTPAATSATVHSVQCPYAGKIYI